MKFKAFLQIHLAIFLFGFTAILGDIIDLPLISLVWWRVFLSIVFLVPFIKVISIYRKTNKVFMLRHAFIGLLVAIHWLAFYGSIKVSNASIVLIAMSTTSLITALVEPLMIRASKWKAFDLAFSILIIPAMILIYYNADEMQQMGLWIGLFAAAVGAVFSVLNKMWIVEGKEYEVTFIQQGSVWLSLSLLMAGIALSGNKVFYWPIGTDWIYLIIFAVVCTVLAYFLYLKAMLKISAFDVSFAFNMEPVYGLIMAALILKDHKVISFNIYLGILFILLMVATHTYIKSRKKKQKDKILSHE